MAPGTSLEYNVKKIIDSADGRQQEAGNQGNYELYSPLKKKHAVGYFWTSNNQS